MSIDINQIIKEKLRKAIEVNLKGDNLIALDIGSGTGILAYQLFHTNKFRSICGVELIPKEGLVNEESKSHTLFYQASEGHESLKRYVEFDNYHKIDLYNFYCEYVKAELKNKPLIKEEFENVFQFTFDTEFRDYSNDELFDLIILSRVLHYNSKKEQIKIIKYAIDKLNNGGVIFIVNRPGLKNGIDLKNILEPISNRFRGVNYNDKFREHYFYTLVKIE